MKGTYIEIHSEVYTYIYGTYAVWVCPRVQVSSIDWNNNVCLERMCSQQASNYNFNILIPTHIPYIIWNAVWEPPILCERIRLREMKRERGQ